MKFLSIAVRLLCLATSVVAAGPSAKFTKYSALARSASVELTDSSYEDLIAKPRDFFTAVILTARDARFGCVLCREFEPEWNVIARSWNKGSKPDDLHLIFGTLDFSVGQNTFQKMMLQTAPVVLVFPPTTGPFAKADTTPRRFDFTGPIAAEQMYTWITRQLPEGPKPALVRPVNYMRIVASVTILMGVVTLLTVTSQYILPLIQNRNLWAAISLIAVLLFVSGHMFNHIRAVPYVAGDGKGGISYFAGGFSNQFGMETQIVAAIYAVLSFSTIVLAVKVPRMTDLKAQQMAVLIWAVVMLAGYSFLMKVFKIKNGGYPFYLPPF